mgnify:CR=1 FL=1
MLWNESSHKNKLFRIVLIFYNVLDVSVDTRPLIKALELAVNTFKVRHTNSDRVSACFFGSPPLEHVKVYPCHQQSWQANLEVGSYGQERSECETLSILRNVQGMRMLTGSTWYRTSNLYAIDTYIWTTHTSGRTWLEDTMISAVRQSRIYAMQRNVTLRVLFRSMCVAFELAV